MRYGVRMLWATLSVSIFIGTSSWAEESTVSLPIQITWGYTSRPHTPFTLQIYGKQMQCIDFQGVGLEIDELKQGVGWETHAGGEDIDGVSFSIIYSPTPVALNSKIHSFWKEYIHQSNEDTSQRLQQDPAFRIDSRILTLQLNREGTKGCSLTVDQLLQHKTFWIPSLDLYLTAGEIPVPYSLYRREIDSFAGRRILDQVHTEPEATYELYTSRWEDMGRPDYVHPSQPAPGHVVCVAWDSSIPKFGIDRFAGVWNDYGNSDRFRFWIELDEWNQSLPHAWKNQRLRDGLPVITTLFEKDGLTFAVEQFAYPLYGIPEERRGDIPMVLFQKLKVTNTGTEIRDTVITLIHQRKFDTLENPHVILQPGENRVCLVEEATGQILFSLDGSELLHLSCSSKKLGNVSKDENPILYETKLTLALNPQESGEWIIKLPSPIVSLQDREKLLSLDYQKSLEKTLQFWQDDLSRGAEFSVPEKAVNDLFRTNLWHARRLPRRHGGSEDGVQIDIPYSNFAYDQNGIPWPVNQAVYVDSMLYDLRGYHEDSVEELLAMFQKNQESNGHIGGFANWGVYTPSMLYAVAKNYLLSQDRAALERLLPSTLKSLDWCLQEIHKSSENKQVTLGLIRSPLNDLTGEGIWAFTQAYMYAGLNLLGTVLQQIQHPRAQECLDTAFHFRRSIETAFAKASLQSPLVSLRDRTWIPYVPCEALSHGRMVEQWYPTDVDTGATHLIRLQAIPADSDLAESLLNDHEDNLYLHGWGMANEPVYNQQATAYLFRDDPEAVIRSFYSMMACAFSHTVFEPVEHRWFWGQYFGPPSTDGAWFELYRNMLIHERENETLLLCQATPRRWLEDGQQIAVKNAPTYYGKISFTVTSHIAQGQMEVHIDRVNDLHPQILLVRLRHPQSKPIRSVLVNDQDWRDFDVQKEWIAIQNPTQNHYVILANY